MTTLRRLAAPGQQMTTDDGTVVTEISLDGVPTFQVKDRYGYIVGYYPTVELLAAAIDLATLKVAMPGRVRDRFPVLAPRGPLTKPREVIIARPAQGDLDDLAPDERVIADRLLDQLRAGRAPLEAKHRPPLNGTFTIDVREDGRDTGWRIGCYTTTGDAWVVYWVGPHDYQQAELRMRAVKTSVKAYRCTECDERFPDRSAYESHLIG